MIQKNNSIVSMLSQRYSGYAYDPDRPVTKEQLESILKAGQLAVSASNDQPWRFIVCDRNNTSQAYNKVLDSLVAFNQEWAKNAPVLLVVLAVKNSHKGRYNRWAEYDSGAAAMSMMLEAEAQGLMAHQMGGFDEEKLAESFSLPTDVVPMAVMAIGYNAEQKTKKKARRSLTEIFFFGEWKE